jgi:hypothetical protein
MLVIGRWLGANRSVVENQNLVLYSGVFLFTPFPAHLAQVFILLDGESINIFPQLFLWSSNSSAVALELNFLIHP